MTVADLIIANILYLVCCIPIVTISAAQAGLFTAMRTMLDPKDDRSVAKAFFRGFRDGFVASTMAGSILLLILAALIFVFANTLAVFFAGGSLLPVILSGLAAALAYITHSLIGPFHASFGCTVGQLLRNCLLTAFAYPLRALLVAVLTALPVIVFFIRMDIVMGGIVAIIALYYSTAYLGCCSLLKKPFLRLKKSFNEANGIVEEDEDEE